jgi:hypothetical protein
LESSRRLKKQARRGKRGETLDERRSKFQKRELRWWAERKDS